MMVEIIQKLVTRDLSRLKKEIGLYRSEQIIWYIEKEISNSAGNLCLHLVGNLNAFIGAVLGGSGYIRQRDLEFSLKDIPRAELLKKIDDTISIVTGTLNQLTDEVLSNEYPLLVFEEKTSTGYFLVHLATHLNYHLGQVNYHRRLLDK